MRIQPKCWVIQLYSKAHLYHGYNNSNCRIAALHDAALRCNCQLPPAPINLLWQRIRLQGRIGTTCMESTSLRQRKCSHSERK